MLIYLLYIPGIVLLWIFICCTLSLLGGWYKLGKKFKEAKSDTHKFSAEQHDVEHLKQGIYFRGVSGAMGLPFVAVSYSNCFHVIVGETALGLRMTPLFRFLSPHLYIPWKEINRVTYSKKLFIPVTRVYVKGYMRRITLYGRAGLCVFKQHQQTISSPSNTEVRSEN